MTTLLESRGGGLASITTSGPPLLVVSPHFDDVPLSCHALVERAEPMTVLHVCTARPVPAVSTEWDRKSGFADSDEATDGRRAEERAAFAGTPHEFVDAGVLDSQYTDGVRTEHDLRAIADAVGAWIDEAGGRCTVAIPVGAGRREGELVPLARLKSMLLRSFLPSVHPDHVAARDGALLAVLARPDVDVVLYEELPYRWTRRGDRVAAELARRFGPQARVERVDLPVDRRAKAARLAAYATQIPLMFPTWAQRPGRLHRMVPGTERYWRVVR